MENLIYVLPTRISEMLYGIPQQKLDQVTEIRLRVGKPICIFVAGQEYMLQNGGLSKENGAIFLAEDATALLRRVHEHSPYIHNESIRQGYITVNGGHRIGISGEAVYENGAIKYVNNISSFCIRCAHQVKGCFTAAQNRIFYDGLCSCLFYSLPGGGKTTMLRDACRVLSNSGYNVALIDERNEIGAAGKGIPSLDVGRRCDVLSGCARKTGILMAVRALAPDIIVTDELGTREDFEAVNTAIDSGIIVIASIHADSIQNIKKKEYAHLLHFDRYVHLRRGLNNCAVREIYNGEFEPVEGSGRKLCCI